MITRTAIIIAAMAWPAWAGAIATPSGQQVTLDEVLITGDAQTQIHRYRFVAPQISNTVAVELVEADMSYLCTQIALPEILASGTQPDQIVISLSGEPTEFGVATPDVVQFFEGYSTDGTTCIWEPF